MAVLHVEIVTGPLPALTLATPRADAGAEVIFHGRVRGIEHGDPIASLFYEHYAGMAERELRRVAEETVAAHRGLDLACWHRVGDVPVGETSLRVIARTHHRAEAWIAIESFISAVKTDVPIWKWSVGLDGAKRPT